jgi:virulence factor Mce-like protein
MRVIRRLSPWTRPLALGATLMVVATVAASCGIVGGGGGAPSLHLTAYFSRTISLYPQSDVKILGLTAGEVKKIEVVGTKVRVDFVVNGDVPVPADVKATIIPQSLIGERYLQLFPAWTNGPKLTDRSTIPIERTTVPVEPDEALASLKTFLENLNPDGAHRLVTNLADDLAGQGQVLNDALHNFANLTETLAGRSDSLGQIIDNFDKFTATLVTRERQLGQVMDDFATLTGVLADERKHVEALVHNLASVAASARDLIATHKAGLDRDLTTLAKVAKSVDANLANVLQLLDSGPVLATGLQNAYDPAFHRIDLRNSFSPTAAQAIRAALGPIAPSPLTEICLPVDVDCTITASAAAPNATGAVGAPAATTSTTTSATTGTTMILKPAKPADELNDLLGRLQPRPKSSRSSSLVGTDRGLFHALGRTARGLARTAIGVLQ